MIWTIIIGLVAGLLARAIKPGNDAMCWIMTIILGIAGAFLGGFTGLAFSVIGAIILLFIYELIMSKR